MFAYAVIPLTCWACALLAAPRRPAFGNEEDELVYSRLLGRQELLRLLAIVATGVAFFAFVLALPSHAARDAGYSRAGGHYCTVDGAAFPRCYSRRSDGTWVQE